MQLGSRAFAGLVLPFVAASAIVGCAGSAARSFSTTHPDDAGSIASSEDTPATWSALYASIFGPAGTASCSISSACHQEPGIAGGGFWVCGMSSTECYKGMVGVLVPMGGAADARTTALYGAMRRPDCTQLGATCNMPKSPVYTFTPAEVDQVVGWIQAGAPNN